MFNFDLIKILLTIPGILIAFSFNGFMRALVADKLGDSTPRNMGKLSLSPKAHIDILGLILIVLIGFGWPKPVITNPNNFKNPKRDDTLVSLAGPFVNLIVAVLFIFFIKLVFIFNIYNYLGNSISLNLIMICFYTANINIILFLFSLLPVPPLQGFSIVRNWIPIKYNEIINSIEKYGFVILILLMVSGVLGKIIGKPTAIIINSIVTLFNVPI